MVKSRWSDRNQALATVSWNNLSKSMPEPLVLDELNLMFQGQNIINLNKLSSRNILLGLTFCFAVRNINCFQLRKTVKQIASFKNNLLFNIQFSKISEKLKWRIVHDRISINHVYAKTNKDNTINGDSSRFFMNHEVKKMPEMLSLAYFGESELPDKVGQ